MHKAREGSDPGPERLIPALELFATELEWELKNNILPWWMDHMPDKEFGGFLGKVDHENEATPGAGKGSVMNARILWTFSAAYGMYGDPSYLEMADRAFHFYMEHFMDRKYGGVYWELEPDGQVTSSRKQIYALAFAIYALSEYWKVRQKDSVMEEAISLFRVIESHALDRDRNGYLEAFSREWGTLEDFRLSEKDHNESKTMNTHLHLLEAYTNLYRIWKDRELAGALENLVTLFLDRFIQADTRHLQLFFDDEWHRKSSLVSFGHDIECSWLLPEAAEVLGNPGLVTGTRKAAVQMATASLEGLDGDGGLFYEYFPGRKEFDTDKHWWPQAEALVGFHNAYQLSGDPEFAWRSILCWEFIKRRIIDHTRGEWFWSVDRAGIAQVEHEKAGFWKCPYHNGRACMELIKRISTT